MIAEFSVFPIGAGESLSKDVAEAYRIVEGSGLRHEFHAMGTNIEGDWDEVMQTIKACRDRLLSRANRVSITIRIDDRKGMNRRMGGKVASAREKMSRQLAIGAEDRPCADTPAGSMRCETEDQGVHGS